MPLIRIRTKASRRRPRQPRDGARIHAPPYRFSLAARENEDVRRFRRVSGELRDMTQGLMRTGSAMGVTVRQTAALRGLVGFYRAMNMFRTATAGMMQGSAAANIAMTVGMTILETSIAVLQLKQIVAQIRTIMGWTQASGHVASWGPLFFIPLAAILIGLGAVAAVAAIWDTSTPTTMSAQPGFTGGSAFAYRPYSQILREYEVRQDNPGDNRTQDVWEDALTR